MNGIQRMSVTTFAGQMNIIRPHELYNCIQIENMRPELSVWQYYSYYRNSYNSIFSPDEPESVRTERDTKLYTVEPKKLDIAVSAPYGRIGLESRRISDMKDSKLRSFLKNEIDILVSKMVPSMYVREFSMLEMEKLIHSLYEKAIIRDDAVCLDVQLSKYQKFFLITRSDSFRLFVSESLTAETLPTVLHLRAHLGIFNEDAMILGRYDVNKMFDDHTNRLRY